MHIETGLAGATKWAGASMGIVVAADHVSRI